MTESSVVPRLLNLYLYPTMRCNLQCRHCWVFASPYRQMQEDELDLGELKKVIDDAIELGLRSIKLTGGEPLIRKDTFSLIEYAIEKDLTITLETNGILVTGTLVDMLRHASISKLAVSLDGASPENYAKLRLSRTAFEKAIAAIRTFAEAGLRPQAIMCLFRENLDDIENVVRVAKEAGAGAIKLLPITGWGRASSLAEDDLLLNIGESVNILRFAKSELQKRYDIFVAVDYLPIAFHAVPIIQKELSSCNLPNLLTILPNGDVTMCGAGGGETPDLIYGNIRETPIAKIWRDHPFLREIRNYVASGELEGICHYCMLKTFCRGQCRAMAYARYGSLRAPHPVCEEAHREGIFPLERLISPYDGYYTPS